MSKNLRGYTGTPFHGFWNSALQARVGRVRVLSIVVPLLLVLALLRLLSGDSYGAAPAAFNDALSKCVKDARPPVNFGRPYSTDRGAYLVGRGLYQMDEHPLSLFFTKKEREGVLAWIASPPSTCVTELVESQVPVGTKKLLVVHTSLEDGNLSMLLNQLVSLNRVGLGVKDVFLIVYHYEPISKAAHSILNDRGFMYASAWDFEVPQYMARESRLSPLEFFFVRNVINLKILKMGYRVFQVDADVVFLNRDPWSGFEPHLYSIEAASEGSPSTMRGKWGYTLNCGYMCISADQATIQFYQEFLFFSFDYVVPIDQWAFNLFLDGSRVKFDVHLTPKNELVNLPVDHGPLVGNVTFGGHTIFIRGLEPRSYLTGRWLNYALKSHVPLHEYAAENFDQIRSVHPTHMQQGLENKINWLRESKLWFLKDDWQDILPENLAENAEILDNKEHAPGW